MYTTETIIVCLAFFAYVVSSKPTMADDTSTSQFGQECHVDVRQIQQPASEEETSMIAEHVMCGGLSAGLVTDLVGLSFDANRARSKILSTFVKSSHAMQSINRSILPINIPSMSCNNVTDYLIHIYGLVKNVSTSLEEIETSSSCSGNIICRVLQADLAQMSRKASQTVCSMAANGLYRIANISSVSIGLLPSVSACADHVSDHVSATDVLKMIYQLTTLLEQATMQAYDDVASECNLRNCNKLAAEIIG